MSILEYLGTTPEGPWQVGDGIGNVTVERGVYTYMWNQATYEEMRTGS
jgi:hypothetical protein